MLISLHVKNMALIKEEEIFFGEGLNILTGETGAGKSILIGSVNVALGMGNFRDYVTDEKQDALVELTFESDQPDILDMLDQAGISTEDKQIVITRKYHAGRSVNRINGESVSVAFIRELAAHLIDIHGQHEHQSLLYPRFHLALLDRWCGHEMEALLEECRQAWQENRQYEKQMEEAVLDEKERIKKADILTYEINEISRAALVPGEDDRLEKEYTRMANAQKIMQELGTVLALTSSSDGAGDMVSRGVRSLSMVSDCDEQVAALEEQLAQIEDLLGGFSRELSAYLDDFSYDEQQFYETGQRLDLLNHLKSKYGKTIPQILSYMEEQQQELEKLQDYENYLAGLKRKAQSSKERLLQVCGRISAIRKKKAVILGKQITKALQDLNFADARFEITFEETRQPGADGYDAVCFMIAANPGMPLRPLQDTASGGELSRIMLAIKAVMAQQDEVAALIFDEIDTGISGRTAQKVSEKMALIARHHQVLCITHLAQIAAMADTHFAITKEIGEGTARTRISVLDEEGSILELARILGGTVITDSVMHSAREMRMLSAQRKKDIYTLQDNEMRL